MPYTSQGGKIPWFFIPLIGRKGQIPASTHLLVSNSQFLNLNLHYLPPCPVITGWKRQLTIDIQDARSFRKHLPMCFNAHMAPVFVQQLGLRLLLPLIQHPHFHSLLQLLVIAFHNGLQEAQYNDKVLHLHLIAVLGRWYSQLSRNNSQLVVNKPSEAGSVNIGGVQLPCSARRGYIRVTLHCMQYGLQIWSQECGNMGLISGWARMNSSMERPRKKGWQRKSSWWILRSGICIEQIGSKSSPLTSIYFTCL